MDTKLLAAALAWMAEKQTPVETAPAMKAEVEEYAEVSKSFEVIKAWRLDTGSVLVEGWISTNSRDYQNEQVQPEAFQTALPSYMARMAPLSYEHNMKPAPVGHVQKAALVRDGRIFFEADHPTDSAPFEHFPGRGTGVYGRAVVNDPSAAGQVMKGNVGGFSWTGRVKRIPLPDGGREFTSVEVMRETTIAAYPVNPDAAIIAAAKETNSNG
jgi:hypothetical protein